MRAATDTLNATQLALYARQAEEFLARRADEPTRWRAVTGFSDTSLYVTADELAALTERMDALLAEYDGRTADPSSRPADARRVALVQLALLDASAPPDGDPAPSDGGATQGDSDTAQGDGGAAVPDER